MRGAFLLEIDSDYSIAAFGVRERPDDNSI